MMVKSVNPYNQEVVGEFKKHSDPEIEEMLQKSQRVFENWRHSEFSERSELLQAVSKTLKGETDRWAEDITLEMGKPITEARAEVEKCAWVCEFYADKAEEFLSDEMVETDAEKSWIQYQPLGSVLAIMPWNYPLWQVFRFAAPAIMAGNVGILKHASNVSQCALNIQQIFLQSGGADGLFQTVLADVEQVEKIINNDVIKAVTLTGSERAGSSVASTAGKVIKKTVLELGGSNAFIVLPDADLDAVVSVGVKARFQNTGQSCIAAKRFILHREIADDFLEKYKQQVSELNSGDPLKEETEIGPMAREDLAKEIEQQVDKSVELGAEILIGGKRDKAYYSPTILTGVIPGMPAFDEELFGPVASVTVANTDEQALDLANNSSFGLGATVCTTDMKRAQKFINGIEDGAVFINALVKSDPRLPFGGTKRSGYGRELSYHGIKEFVNTKTVFIN